MEPDFPIEFIVLGAPVSHQRANPRAREEWKDRVRTSGRACLPDMHFAVGAPLSVTLYYYPVGRMTGDLDNIVKLVLDAMQPDIYLDDDQIERIVVQKFEGDDLFDFPAPSIVLKSCMDGPKPALYVKISNDPFEELRR